MGGERTDTRAYAEIDGREYLVGHDLDLVEVMSKIEEAARSGPAFVDLSDSDRLVSVLISQRSRVVITVRHEPLPHTEDITPDTIRDWEL